MDLRIGAVHAMRMVVVSLSLLHRSDGVKHI
jgi:hypothetical protein